MTEKKTQTTLNRSQSGGFHETYSSALKHDNADIPPDTHCAGVVRYPMYGITAVIDQNYPLLGPPEPLLTDIKNTAAKLEETYEDTTKAHNEACEQHNLESRYREYLTYEWHQRGEVYDMLQSLLAKVAEQPVALVCYEKPEKTCHRHTLRQFLSTKHTGD